jgi:hypothetical protein
MISVKDRIGRTAVNPRLVDLVVEREDGTVLLWIGDREYRPDVSFDEAVAAVDRANLSRM